MQRKIRVILRWEGTWHDSKTAEVSIGRRAGIYMVIAGRKDTERYWDTLSYVLLDIGQSGDTGVRLGGHERESCWKENKPSNSTLLYKFAAMPSATYREIDRRIVECCLRAHRAPKCGTECNKGYNREELVNIQNMGRHWPLGSEYSCPPSVDES